MSHRTFAVALCLSPVALSTAARAQSPAPVEANAPAAGSFEASVSALKQDFEARLAALEAQVAEQKTAREAAEKAAKKATESKWYEKIGLRGYTQLRTTSLFNEDLTPDLVVPADSSVSEKETFLIRRGRFIFSGDVSEHVFLYAQFDAFGSVGGSGDKGLQTRDLYADVALDADKEYRFRVGQSKVPYGFVNLQSSQNRAPMERPDALNSAVEGERDIGVFFYWAPKEIRNLFRDLVRKGLKGSGDYGVLGFGAYSGQGLNRSDQNGEFHWIGRASYPIQFDNGQILELGAQAYAGDFVVSTQTLGSGASAVPAPTAKADGLDDERVALSATLYPQPFGFEAEWTWGEGPELNSTLTAVEVESLHGGYLQVNALIETSKGPLFPFVRWNYFDGARKFRANAPSNEINELDFGVEWAPWPELELAVMYTHTFERTNTTDTSGPAFYERTEDADRLAFQLQWNY
jgi:hypothetical protein